MPDITMCKDSLCPSASICYRHEAQPSEFRQSYFAKSPRDEDNQKCDYILHFTKEEIKTYPLQGNDLISSCCSADMSNWPDSDICPKCKEHTSILCENCPDDADECECKVL